MIGKMDYSFNFNDPVSAFSVFRVKGRGENGEQTTDEYGGMISFLWDDIKTIEQYPYPDDWERYKGEKYYLELKNSYKGNSRIILGSYENMLKYWTMFKNKYPTHGNNER